MKKSLLRFTVGAALSAIAGVACFGQHYNQTNLVSNTSGVAPVTDPQLINPGAYPAPLAALGGSLTTQRDSAHSTMAQEPSNP